MLFCGAPQRGSTSKIVRSAMLDSDIKKTACTVNELLLFCVLSFRLTASHSIVPAE